MVITAPFFSHNDDIQRYGYSILKLKIMKKLLFLLLTVFALGCDAPNQSSEQGAGSELEDRAPAEPAPESDTSSIHSDTTTSGGMNRQNQYDTLK